MIKNIAIEIAAVLLLKNCNFSFLLKFMRNYKYSLPNIPVAKKYGKIINSYKNKSYNRIEINKK